MAVVVNRTARQLAATTALPRRHVENYPGAGPDSPHGIWNLWNWGEVQGADTPVGSSRTRQAGALPTGGSNGRGGFPGGRRDGRRGSGGFGGLRALSGLTSWGGWQGGRLLGLP